MRSKQRAFGLVAIVATVLAFLAAPLAAQSDDAPTPLTPNSSDFEVLRVDLSNDSGVAILRPGSNVDPEQPQVTVTIEGDEVVASKVPIHRSSVGTHTIIVIDNSRNADSIAGISEVRSAALAYLDRIGANTRVMLVEAGSGNVDTRALVPFTSDHSAIRAGIEGITPGAGAVTWNAISDSVSAFYGERGSAVRNVVAFVGSPGSASSVTSDVAMGNLLSADAGLTVVAPEAANLNLSQFLNVASTVRGGGFYRGTSDQSMTEAATLAAEMHESVFAANFKTSSVVSTGGESEATSAMIFSYGGNAERVRIVPDGVAAGDSLAAPPIVESSRFSVLRGSNAALAGIALAIIATLLFSFSMMQIFGGNDDSLNSTLSVYGSQDRTEEQAAADEAFQSQRSKIIEQVVERAEEAAASRGDLSTTTTMLEKAEIPLRVGEAFAVQVGLIVVALILGFIIGGPFLALFLAVPVAIIPMLYVKFKVNRRAKKLEQQLPDTLNLLSSTLKAGYSFIQGIDAVGNEAEEPLAGEFRRTVNEARLGKDLDLALDDLAERVDSIDLVWAIVAIKIQREVGGNLAELLSTVADTMTSRSRLRGEVRALTAEGRMSAIVLLLLPFGVGAAMYMMNKPYISTLWSHTFGYIAMGVAGFSMVAGALWMRKIIDIEI